MTSISVIAGTTVVRERWKKGLLMSVSMALSLLGSHGVTAQETSDTTAVATNTLRRGAKTQMAPWPKEELRRIAQSDDLHISPFREDGATYGTPTWIWSVVIDDDLYVRAYNGQRSRWYQAAMRERAGRISVAGMIKEVTFAPVAGAINDRIDDAYRKKYRGSPYLNAMVSDGPRSATVRIVPRRSADEQ